MSLSSAHFTGTTGARGLHGFELQGFYLPQRSGLWPLAKHADVQYLMVKLGFSGQAVLLVTQAPLTQALKRTVGVKVSISHKQQTSMSFKKYFSLQTKLHFSILYDTKLWPLSDHNSCRVLTCMKLKSSTTIPAPALNIQYRSAPIGSNLQW